jgi:hypothetical protein
MNELDRKIAELKGLGTDEITQYPIDEDLEGRIFPTGDPIKVNWGWSTSDTKALELVDEWIAEDPENRQFSIRYSSQHVGDRWQCSLRPGFLPQWGIAWVEDAPTRPEAICRAYLAAMEWMKGRKA